MSIPHVGRLLASSLEENSLWLSISVGWTRWERFCIPESRRSWTCRHRGQDATPSPDSFTPGDTGHMRPRADACAESVIVNHVKFCLRTMLHSQRKSPPNSAAPAESDLPDFQRTEPADRTEQLRCRLKHTNCRCHHSFIHEDSMPFLAFSIRTVAASMRACASP